MGRNGSPELEKIESYDSGLGSWVQSLCLPMPGVFKSSCLLPLGAVGEVNARLAQAEKNEHPALVEDSVGPTRTRFAWRNRSWASYRRG
jgi:hypothetical protein